MATTTSIISILFQLDYSIAFISPPRSSLLSLRYSRNSFLSSSSQSQLDSILFESHDTSVQYKSNHYRRSPSTIILPDTSAIVQTAASSIPLPSQPQLYTDEADELFGGGVDAEDDYLESESAHESSTSGTSSAPVGDSRMARQPRIGRTYRVLGMRYTTSGYSLSELIEKKDYNTIITSFFVPIAALGVGAVWGSRQLIVKYKEKMDGLLTSYANEMVYHDGDFEEMQMCFDDYKKRLTTLGLKKRDMMMKRYLELYAKKKPVSPQAISSLSHVFSMYKLSEEKAANLLCEVAENMKDKVSSAGKLLFFGRHILRSEDAREKLLPIKTILAGSYRKGGDLMVENSQKAMGEAAYRAAVVSAGKDQTTLTVGWEVLGLDKETAQRIFDEVSNTGFKSKREEIYGGFRQKYDSKGRKVDKDGKVIDEEERKQAEKEDKGASTAGGTGAGSVYECEECGFTLFPAQGREFKFFPDDFKCPECGAAKDKFVDVSGK